MTFRYLFVEYLLNMRDQWNRSGNEENYFTEETLRRLSQKITRWLNTPTYGQVSETEREVLSGRIDVKLHPKGRELIHQIKDKVRNCREAKDYRLGIEIVTQALETEIERLPKDDQDAARRMLLFEKGHLHECRATFEMEKAPLSDPRRKAQFFQAVESYMDADLQVKGGLVTDYALRLSEAAGGAELPDLQIAALAKAFGNNNFVLVGKGDAGAGAITQDLMRRSTDTTVLGHVPGGGDATLYSDIHLPDKNSN